MSTTTAINGQSVKNNGGAGMSVGTLGVNSALTSSLVSKENVVAVNGQEVFGSTPTLTNDTTTASIAGDFAALNNITDTLNTVYQTPVPYLTTGIHKTESSRTYKYTTAFRAGYFNMYNGQFTVAPTVALDTFAQDDAARPSRAVPGELTYRTGAKNPVTDEYSPKNG